MSGSRRHLATLLWIASAALFYRLWRLDLMSFSFDFAAALFRARETLRTGFTPLTGIQNSLGFRNPGGFIWIILPSALLSPRPEVTAAWMGLLTISAMWPLYKIGRRLTGRAPYIALMLCGVHPWMIFGSRTIWAQHLMPAAGIWALYFLSLLVEGGHRPTTTRVPSRTDDLAAPSGELVPNEPALPKAPFLPAFAALAILAAATAIHISGILYFILAALFLVLSFRRSPRMLPAPTIAACILLILFLAPSGFDYLERKSHASVEAETMATPAAIVTRLHDSIAGVFGYFKSTAPISGLEKDMSPISLQLAAGFDLLFLLLCFAGIARCVLSYRDISQQPVPGLIRFLPIWIFAPPVIGALLLARPNGTYFAACVPTIYLCADLGAQWITAGRRLLSSFLPALAVIAGVAYIIFITECLATIDRTRFAGYAYYIPVRDQRAVAHRLAREVPAGHILHLKGNWFAHTFNYLASEEAGAPRQVAGKFAVVTELYWLPRDVKSFLAEKFEQRSGEIVYRVFPDRPAAEQFIQQVRRQLLPSHESSAGG